MKVLIKVWEGENKTTVQVKKLRNPSKREKQRALRYDRPTPVAKYVRTSRNNPADKVIFDVFDKVDFSEWPEGEYECEIEDGFFWQVARVQL